VSRYLELLRDAGFASRDVLFRDGRQAIFAAVKPAR
jgi:hypothetical protein